MRKADYRDCGGDSTCRTGYARAVRNRTSPIFPDMEPLRRGEKIACLVCLGVSLCLIARMWLAHRKDGVFKKTFWSFILLVPMAG
jgi:hypothetical protein